MINILGIVNDRSFGIWTKNTLKTLNYLNQDYSLFPIHGIQLSQDEVDFHNPVRIGLDRAKTFDKNAPSLKIWHAFELAEQVGSKKLAWTLFELDRLSDLEKHHLNSLDHLILPSEWHKRIAASSINVPISVCPLGVDTSKYFPRPELKSKNKTIFLSVGKWEKRKSHDLIPKLFTKAFLWRDNVELWASHNNPFISEQQYTDWKKLYIDTVPGNQLRLIEEWLPENQLNELYNKADAGLCLSKSEGWDLPAIEMLACGLPIIGTNYAAHTQFMNDQNTHLVNIDQLELAVDGRWFHGTGQWANIGPAQEEQIIEHLRAIHKEKQEKGTLSNQAGLETAQEFSWLNAIQQLVEIIKL